MREAMYPLFDNRRMLEEGGWWDICKNNKEIKSKLVVIIPIEEYEGTLTTAGRTSIHIMMGKLVIYHNQLLQQLVDSQSGYGTSSAS